MGKIQVLKGRIRLLVQFSRINLYMTAITLIGLTIALSVVSASFIYLESNQASYYLETIQDPRLENYFYYELLNETSPYLYYDRISFIQEMIEEEINQYRLGEVLQSHSLSPVMCLARDIRFLNYSSTSVIGIDLDETVLLDCVNRSELPVEKNEVIFYSSEWESPLKIGDDFNISKLYRDSLNNYQIYNFSLKISGLITSASINQNSPLNIIIKEESNYHSLLITDYHNFYNLIRTMNIELESLIAQDEIFDRESFHMHLKYYFSIDLASINQKNVVSILDNLLRYRRSKIWYSQPFINLYLGRMSPSFYKIEEDLNIFDDFYILFLVFSVPAFILAFLLVNFSLGLVNERRKRSFTLLKMRGVSTSFIFLILIIEASILAFLSSTMAIILGIPIYMLISSTSGFLLFDSNKLPRTMIISTSTIFFIIVFGLAFTVLSHLKSAVKLSRSKVVELEQAASKKRKRKPKMWGGNLDINLLIIGALGFIVFYSLMTILINLEQQENQAWMTIIILIIFLLFFCQLAILIGGIFSFNRFIPLILHYLGNLSWKRDWRSLAVATRNLSVSRITKYATLLITYTISFLMILSILPSTIYYNSVDHTYYEVGCDIKISAGADESNDLMMVSNLTADLNSIQGLAATGVTRLQYDLIQKIEGYDYIQYYNFIGIDSDYHQIAHWRHYYNDLSLEKMVSSLYDSTAKYPIIIDSFTAKREKLENLGTYSIVSDKSDLIELTVVEISNCWPTWWSDENARNIITKRSLIENLSLALGEEENYINVEIWCKITSNYDKNDIIDQVANITASYGISQHDIAYTIEIVQIDPESLSDIAFWIIINFNYLVSLVIILIMIILFTTVRIASHNTEIGLSRALGMKIKQVFLLMFMEPIVLFMISGIPGIIFGSFFTFFLLQWTNPILTFGTGPPFIVYPNFYSVFLIYGSIFIVTVLSGLIAAIIASRANISKILKVE